MPSGQPDAIVTFERYLDGETIRVRVNIIRPGQEPIAVPIRTEALYDLGMHALHILGELKGLRQ